MTTDLDAIIIGAGQVDMPRVKATGYNDFIGQSGHIETKVIEQQRTIRYISGADRISRKYLFPRVGEPPLS